jgi:diguanylate cyclase (GGDEF)-like protein
MATYTVDPETGQPDLFSQKLDELFGRLTIPEPAKKSLRQLVGQGRSGNPVMLDRMMQQFEDDDNTPIFDEIWNLKYPAQNPSPEDSKLAEIKKLKQKHDHNVLRGQEADAQPIVGPALGDPLASGMGKFVARGRGGLQPPPTLKSLTPAIAPQAQVPKLKPVNPDFEKWKADVEAETEAPLPSGYDLEGMFRAGKRPKVNERTTEYDWPQEFRFAAETEQPAVPPVETPVPTAIPQAQAPKLAAGAPEDQAFGKSEGTGKLQITSRGGVPVTGQEFISAFGQDLKSIQSPPVFPKPGGIDSAQQEVSNYKATIAARLKELKDQIDRTPPGQAKSAMVGVYNKQQGTFQQELEKREKELSNLRSTQPVAAEPVLGQDKFKSSAPIANRMALAQEAQTQDRIDSLRTQLENANKSGMITGAPDTVEITRLRNELSSALKGRSTIAAPPDYSGAKSLLDEKAVQEGIRQFLSQDPREMVKSYTPWIGPAIATSEWYQYYLAGQRIASGAGTPTEKAEDDRLVKDYEQRVTRDPNATFQVLNVFASQYAFATEIGKSVLYEPVKAKTLAFMEKWLGGWSTKVAGGLPARVVAGTIASTPNLGLATRAASETFRRLSPQIEAGKVTKEGEAIPSAVYDAFVSQVIEFASERSGHLPSEAASGIGNWLIKKMPQLAGAQAMISSGFEKLRRARGSQDLIDGMLRTMQFHGTLEEMGEERMGELARYLLRVDKEYDVPTIDDLVKEAVGFGLIPVGARILEKIKAKDDVKQGGGLTPPPNLTTQDMERRQTIRPDDIPADLKAKIEESLRQVVETQQKAAGTAQVPVADQPKPGSETPLKTIEPLPPMPELGKAVATTSPIAEPVQTKPRVSPLEAVKEWISEKMIQGAEAITPGKTTADIFGAQTAVGDRRSMERATTTERREPGTRLFRFRMDLDNFKALNDEFGHQKGDEALQIVTDLLKSKGRPGDQSWKMPARPGGDEFAIIMEVADSADPAKIAQDYETAIAAALEAKGLRYVNEVEVGASMSGVEWKPGMSIQQWDEASDKAAIARKAERGVSQKRESKPAVDIQEVGTFTLPADLLVVPDNILGLERQYHALSKAQQEHALRLTREQGIRAEDLKNNAEFQAFEQQKKIIDDRRKDLTSQFRAAQDERNKPVKWFNIGDQVTWEENGKTLTGKVRSADPEEVTVNVDQIVKPGGVPLGRVSYVKLNNPSLKKQTEETPAPVKSSETVVPPADPLVQAQTTLEKPLHLMSLDEFEHGEGALHEVPERRGTEFILGTRLLTPDVGIARLVRDPKAGAGIVRLRPGAKVLDATSTEKIDEKTWGRLVLKLEESNVRFHYLTALSPESWAYLFDPQVGFFAPQAGEFNPVTIKGVIDVLRDMGYDAIKGKISANELWWNIKESSDEQEEKAFDDYTDEEKEAYPFVVELKPSSLSFNDAIEEALQDGKTVPAFIQQQFILRGGVIPEVSQEPPDDARRRQMISDLKLPEGVSVVFRHVQEGFGDVPATEAFDINIKGGPQFITIQLAPGEDLQQRVMAKLEDFKKVEPVKPKTSDIQKIFDETIAKAQRGAPEVAMVEVQKASGGGIINTVVEHVGDLTHRMTERVTFDVAGYKVVRDKIQTALRILTNEYGFAKEFAENVESNAKALYTPLKGYSDKLDFKLSDYAEAHRKLPVYNEVQRLARDAAVDLGEKDWAAAIGKLQALLAISDQGKDAWVKAAHEYDPQFQTAPVSKEPWQMTRGEHRASLGHPRALSHTLTDADHAVAVADAYARGKAVPPNVLSEYPELTTPKKEPPTVEVYEAALQKLMKQRPDYNRENYSWNGDKEIGKALGLKDFHEIAKEKHLEHFYNGEFEDRLGNFYNRTNAEDIDKSLPPGGRFMYHSQGPGLVTFENPPVTVNAKSSLALKMATMFASKGDRVSMEKSIQNALSYGTVPEVQIAAIRSKLVVSEVEKTVLNETALPELGTKPLPKATTPPGLSIPPPPKTPGLTVPPATAQKNALDEAEGEAKRKLEARRLARLGQASFREIVEDLAHLSTNPVDAADSVRIDYRPGTLYEPDTAFVGPVFSSFLSHVFTPDLIGEIAIDGATFSAQDRIDNKKDPFAWMQEQESFMRSLATRVADAALSTASEEQVVREWVSKNSELVKALSDAVIDFNQILISSSRPLVLVTLDSGKAQAITSLLHELAHARQMGIARAAGVSLYDLFDNESFMADPLAIKAVGNSAVLSKAYEPAHLAIEISARLAAGEHQDLGLSEDEAVTLFKHYFNLVLERHGDRAYTLLGNLTPTLEDLIHAAVEPIITTYEARKHLSETAAGISEWRGGRSGEGAEGALGRTPLAFSLSEGSVQDIDPEDLNDLSIVGAATINRGALGRKAWTQSMLAEFGNEFSDYLEVIYDLSVAVYLEYFPDQAETVRQANEREYAEGDGKTGVAGERPPDVLPAGEGGEPGGTATGGGGRVSSPDEDTQRGGESPRGSDTRTGPAGDSIPGGGVIRPVRRNGRFHRITDPATLGFGSPKDRFKANVRAIKHFLEVERKMKSENYIATKEDREIVGGFVGWGAIPQAFVNMKGWYDEYTLLRQVLTEQQWQAAYMSTLNAHYTSGPIVEAMWRMAQKLGFRGGSVLDNAWGIGNFAGLAPQSIIDNSEFYGIEMDEMSAKLSRFLYPDAVIAHAEFQAAKVENGSKHLIITNVPFGAMEVFDPRYDIKFTTIHDYYFVRSLDILAPGGIMIAITSAGTLDKPSSEMRGHIATRADLIAAYRLPNNAFEKNAGTRVTTDILVLRKRFPNETRGGADFGTTREIPAVGEDLQPIHRRGKGGDLVRDKDGNYVQDTVDVNEYFSDNPSHVFGRIVLGHGLRGNQEKTVIPFPDVSAETFFERVIEELPEGAFGSDSHLVKDEQFGNQEQVRIRPGLTRLSPDGSVQVQDRVGGWRPISPDDFAVPRKYLKTPDRQFQYILKELKAIPRIKSLIALRDQRMLVGKVMNETDDDKVVEFEQEKLRQLYDEYRQEFPEPGGLHSAMTWQTFSNDPDMARLLALEDYDPDTGESTKSAIFYRRIASPRLVVKGLSSDPSEALQQVMAERGRPDLEYLATLWGKDLPETVEILSKAGLIYKNPANGLYETQEQYLSGALRTKLKIAKEFAADFPQYSVNISALEAAIEKHIPPTPIEIAHILPGATWIPQETYKEFFAKILDVADSYLRREISITENHGSWKVDVGKLEDRTPNAFTWGARNIHKRYGADKLFEMALNKQIPTLRMADPDAEKGSDRTIVDERGTQALRAKLALLNEEFMKFCKTGSGSQALEESFNYYLNNMHLREYDGSHLTFEGMDPEIREMFYPHQRNGVWRNMQEGRSLMAHCVGAGKTFIIIASAMELKRIGAMKKSILIVPNHLVPYWAGEFAKLYPSSNVLAAKQEDFTGDTEEEIALKEELAKQRTQQEYEKGKEIRGEGAVEDKKISQKRKLLFERIGTGDWDVVIMSHTSYGYIPINPRYETVVIQEQIDNLFEALRGAQEIGGREGARHVKKLSKSLQSLKARMLKLIEASKNRKDDTMYFDEMGFDTMFVDESHAFKNLPFYTKMGNIAGLSSGDSQRSTDMLVKLRYLQKKRNGRGIFFATATPITRTMAEVYINTSYVAPDLLLNAGLRSFDQWASSFGKTAEVKSVGVDGKWKIRTKFAEFINVPELSNMFRAFAEVRLAGQINLPTPKILGEKTTLVEVPPSQLVIDFNKEIIDRAEALTKKHDPKEDNWLKLTVDARKLTVDPRLYREGVADDPGHMGNVTVKMLLQNYKDSESVKGTQLVFAEYYRLVIKPTQEAVDRAKALGLKPPRDREVFNLFDDMRKQLMAAGVPSSEIVDLSTIKKAADKEKVFIRMRAGQVRFLFATTAKAGTGTNVQTRLWALFHMDPTWNPADMEQRTGRIIRPGNELEKMLAEQGKEFQGVQVNMMIAVGTFAQYMYQTVQDKQLFITQFMSGSIKSRTMIDAVGDVLLNAGSAKAMASGDPRTEIYEKLKQKAQDLRNESQGFLDSQAKLKSEQRHLQGEVAALKRYQAIKERILEKFRLATSNGENFAAVIDGNTFEDREAAEKFYDEGQPQRSQFSVFGVDITLKFQQSFIFVSEVELRSHYKDSPNYKENEKFADHRLLVNIEDDHQFEPELLSRFAAKGDSTFTSIRRFIGTLPTRIEESKKRSDQIEVDIAKIEPLLNRQWDKWDELKRLQDSIIDLEIELGIRKKDDKGDVATEDEEFIDPNDLGENEEEDGEDPNDYSFGPPMSVAELAEPLEPERDQREVRQQELRRRAQESKPGGMVDEETFNLWQRVGQDVIGEGVTEPKAWRNRMQEILGVEAPDEFMESAFIAASLAESSQEQEADPLFDEGEPDEIGWEELYHEAKLTQPTMPPIQIAPMPGGDRNVKFRDILNRLADGIGHYISVASFRGSKAWGRYQPGNSAVLIRHAGSIPLAIHEMGHFLDDRFGIVKRWVGSRQRSPFDQELLGNFANNGGYSSVEKTGRKSSLAYQRAEGVAEFIRVLTFNPAAAAAAAPKFFDYVVNNIPPTGVPPLNIDAEVLTVLKEFSDSVRQWAGQSLENQSFANVSMQPKQRSVLERLKDFARGNNLPFNVTGWEKIRSIFLDEFLPFHKAVEFLKGVRTDLGGILPGDDPSTLLGAYSALSQKCAVIAESGMIVARPKTGRYETAPGIEGGQRWLLGENPDGSMVLDTSTEEDFALEIDKTVIWGLNTRVADRGDKIFEQAYAAISNFQQTLEMRGMSLPDVLASKDYKDFKKKALDKAEADAYVLSGFAGGTRSDYRHAKDTLREMRNTQPDQVAKWREMFRRYNLWSDANLRYWVDKGRLSQDAYNYIKDRNEQYYAMNRIMVNGYSGKDAPTIGFLDPSVFSTGISRKLSFANQPLQAMHGSGQEVQNPYDSLMAQTFAFVREADRNEVLSKFTDLLVNNTRTKMHDGLVMQLDSVGREAKPEDRNSVLVYRSGKPTHWVFPDQSLYQSLDNWGKMGVTDKIAEMVGFVTAKVPRWLITHGPGFVYRSLIRESLQRGVLSETGSTPFDVWAGYLDEELKAYRLAGGSQKPWNTRDLDNIHKELSQVMKAMVETTRNLKTGTGSLKVKLPDNAQGYLMMPFKGMGRVFKSYGKFVQEFGEVRSRMAEYKSAFEYAKANFPEWSDYDASLWAAQQSRELLDYYRVGYLMKPVVKLIPFLNSSLQGKARTIRGMVDEFRALQQVVEVTPGIELSGPGIKRATSAVLGEMAGGFAFRFAKYVVFPRLMAYAYNMVQGDDEEYRQLPAWRRLFFLNFKACIPGTDIKTPFFIIIPTPFELGFLGAGVELAIESMRGENPDAFKEWAVGAIQSFLPVDDFMPSGLPRAVIEGVNNRSWRFDNYIVPPWEEGTDPRTRDPNRGSTIGRAFEFVSEHLGYSVDARKVDNFIQNMSASTGYFVSALTDVVTKPSSKTGWRLAASTGLLTESPAGSSPDVQWVMRTSALLKDKDSREIKHLGDLLRLHRDGGTVGEREDRAKQVRAYAAELRRYYSVLYEDIVKIEAAKAQTPEEDKWTRERLRIADQELAVLRRHASISVDRMEKQAYYLRMKEVVASALTPETGLTPPPEMQQYRRSFDLYADYSGGGLTDKMQRLEDLWIQARLHNVDFNAFANSTDVQAIMKEPGLAPDLNRVTDLAESPRAETRKDMVEMALPTTTEERKAELRRLIMMRMTKQKYEQLDRAKQK